jgi:hypothetical protein
MFFFLSARKKNQERTRGCVLLLCTCTAKAGSVLPAKGQGHIIKAIDGSSRPTPTDLSAANEKDFKYLLIKLLLERTRRRFDSKFASGEIGQKM